MKGFQGKGKKLGTKFFEGWNFLDLIFLLLFKVDVYSREEFLGKVIKFLGLKKWFISMLYKLTLLDLLLSKYA